jgi:hypothetical protein
MATKKKKIKYPLVIVQFTMKGNLHTIGSFFKGSEEQVKLLINKNYLKWQ